MATTGDQLAGVRGRNWVLAAMIFAVSVTFIDQTIVSIAVPTVQRELTQEGTSEETAGSAQVDTPA